MRSEKKTKDIIIKELNMITKKSEAKTVAKHISCDCKCKFISTACNSNKEIIVSTKKDYS